MSAVARLPYFELAPKALQSLIDHSTVLRKGPLRGRLIELVFMRLSQINGCAWCMDMHWQELVKMGVEPRHINAVAGWQEAPFFSDRERAALRWAELVNAMPQRETTDEEFARLKHHFSDEEIAELGFAIAAIRAWNLLNVSFRNPLPA
jgi:AhpD family alkylhydroperoxidase